MTIIYKILTTMKISEIHIVLKIFSNQIGGHYVMNRINLSKKTMKLLGVKNNSLSNSFDEFESIKNNFIYGEVWQQEDIDNKLKSLITIATLITIDSNGLENHLHIALNIGVKPEELLEIFHQVTPYIGFSQVEKSLEVLKNIFLKENIMMPLKHNSVVTEENRLKKGIEVQKEIFGEIIDNMRSSAIGNEKILQDYLSAYCFGDTYTRKVLDLKTRELITFICLSALGGCDKQVKAHVAGNLSVGNTKDLLFLSIYQSLPYIGFPKCLNAISAIKEITD